MNLTRLLHPSAARRATGKTGALAALLMTAAFACATPWAPANVFAASQPPPFAATDTTAFVGISWRIDPHFVCEGDSIRLVFTACTCNFDLLSLTEVDSSHVRLETHIRPDILCAVCNPDSLSLNLGPFPAGPRTVDIEIVATLQYSDGHTEAKTGFFSEQFDVNACPPPGSKLPYLDDVFISEACPGDSIAVVLQGRFPDPCFHLLGLSLSPSPIVGPAPEPDVLIVTYGRNYCVEPACPQVVTPWAASIRMPPLPARAYQLLVQAELREITCSDSSYSILGNTSVPFVVSDSCSTGAPGCFFASFPVSPTSSCDLIVGPGRPGQIGLQVMTGVALAGLQGDLEFHDVGFRISKLEAVGDAANMTLSWTRTANGARFVMFAPSGAPIPAQFTPNTVLMVGIESVPSPVIVPVVYLRAVNLVAADINGLGVPGCPVRLDDRLTLGTRICRGAPCDFNADAVADVRDLVVMVHCVVDPAAPCTVNPRDQLDCDKDGGVDIDDVLCCARFVLGGQQPDSTIGRDAPEVSVALSDVRAVDGGVDVALAMTAAHVVGAARLDLDYPADRYELVSAEVPDRFRSGWLQLHEAASGRLTIGLIAVPSDRPVDARLSSANLPVVVHLRLREGQTAGGQVVFKGGTFAGNDGVALVTGTRPIVIPLGTGTSLALGTAYPNPARKEMHFALTVAQPGNLEVAIFDLAGRKVSTLFRGPVTVGTREFTWQRTRDDGRAVGSGVYFYRATLGSEVQSRKVMVLSRE